MVLLTRLYSHDILLAMERDLTQRQEAARAIWKARNKDRKEGYNTNRNIAEYIGAFQGLVCFLDYIWTLEDSSVVLDIGAGTTQGICQLSESGIGEGLSFFATSLTKINPGRTGRFIGKERFSLTRVESLRGIGNHSVAGILALKSIAYSGAPELAIRRMDQVLTPGGAIKAVFHNKDDNFFHSHLLFSKELSSLGYDIAILEQYDWLDIMVAIKPGKKEDITAVDLLQKDLVSLPQQQLYVTEFFNAEIVKSGAS